MRPLPLAHAPAGCSLTPAALAEQRGRAERLGATVEHVTREDNGVELRFSADVDECLLRQLIETERECCPFFQIAYQRKRRVLRISLADTRRGSALEALSRAFGGR